MKKVSVGVKGVDELLFGGFPERKSILVTGNCGTGKTIFASHFMNNGGGVYISFEQDKEKLFGDLKEIGIDFKKLEDKDKLRVLGGNLVGIQKLKEKRKASAEDIIEEILEVVEEISAKRVVVDSINLFLMLFDTDKERRNVLYELNYALQQVGCTIVMTCELPEHSQKLSWFGFEEFIADGVVVLKRDYKKDLNLNKRYLEIVKLRGSDFKEGNFPLRITNEGLRVFMNDPNDEFFYNEVKKNGKS